jgi:hypothetical protein
VVNREPGNTGSLLSPRRGTVTLEHVIIAVIAAIDLGLRRACGRDGGWLARIYASQRRH